MNAPTEARLANLPNPNASPHRSPHGPGIAEWARKTLREEQAKTPAVPSGHRITTATTLEQTATSPISLPRGAGWATADTTAGKRAAWVEAPGGAA